ncbi:MAG TPA: hypothetical protein VMY35_10640 [Phycisphaerae bacterium]|nr:hypothetical protein [Phycisphaerae bacterium]
MRDDKAFYFGNDGDVSLEYDEDGNNVLLTAGADWRFSDTQALQLGDGGDFTITHNGTTTAITNATGKIIISGAGANIELSDTVELQFGDASDARIVWNGTGLKLLGLPTAAPSDAGSYLFVSDAGGNTLRIATA